MTTSDAGIDKAVRRHFAGAFPQHTGVVVAVVQPDGEHITTIGEARTDGVFEIGSVTKTFTGILLADMVERHEVRLEDSLASYLPAGVRAPRHNGSDVTLVELSTHTSGFPRLPANLTAHVKDPRNPYAAYSNENLYEAVGALEPKPGHAVEYSNFGAGLLGQLLARKTAKAYGDLVVERICKPLGMTETMVAVDASLSARRVEGHDAKGNATSHWDLPALAGAGALQSTARDMARYLRANISAPEGQLGPAILKSREPRARISRTLQVGLGWHILHTRSGRDVVWHNGGTGGFGSMVAFDPESKIGVAALMNASHTDDLDRETMKLLDELAGTGR